MIVQDIIKKLDQLAPLVYAEEFDNVGLIIGDKKAKVDGILITLDTTLEVIDEAIKNALKQKRKALLLLVKVENGSRFVALELK